MVSNNAESTESILTETLQNMVLESSDVNDFLNGLARLSAKTFSTPTDEVLCGVTLLRPRRAATVASSTERARELDEVQLRFDDGPCMRAARENKMYYVADFRKETRFPEYRQAIAEHGILSAIGLPIVLEGEANAGLDLYSAKEDAFSEDAIEAAQDFARTASVSLRMAVRIAKLTETGMHLQAAMETRTAIDLAAGIIMGQNRCSQDEAVNILKMASSARNTKLNLVAEALIKSVSETPSATHFDD